MDTFLCAITSLGIAGGIAALCTGVKTLCRRKLKEGEKHD